MKVEPQQRNAHPTKDQSGSMNLPTSVEERVKGHSSVQDESHLVTATGDRAAATGPDPQLGQRKSCWLDCTSICLIESGKTRRPFNCPMVKPAHEQVTYGVDGSCGYEYEVVT